MKWPINDAGATAPTPRIAATTITKLINVPDADGVFAGTGGTAELDSTGVAVGAAESRGAGGGQVTS